MAIRIQCPNPDCQASYTVDESIVSRNVKCRRCNSVFSAQPTVERLVGDTQPASAASGSPFPKLPAEFGRYRILELLGRGGMGCVYRAVDTQLGRTVALKIPTLGTQDDSKRASRFVREARASAILQHSNICTVYDAGQIDGQSFIAMEFIEGASLASLPSAQSPMPQSQAIEMVRKLADALAHAHSKGIVHRDLKPANVMVTQGGEPKLMDFGLAKRISEGNQLDTKLTQDGAVMGTPSYMSPEQVRGDQENIGPVSDVYSLGVMLFELLTGQLPYSGNLGVVMGQILAGPVPRADQIQPGVNRQLADVCYKAMAKEIKDRYTCMADFASTLSKIDLDRSSRPASPMQWLQTSKDKLRLRFLTSNPWLIAGIATGVICVFGVVLWLWLSSPTKDANLLSAEEPAIGDKKDAAPVPPSGPKSPTTPTPASSVTPVIEPVGSWLFADLSNQGLATAEAFELQNDQSVLLRGEGRNFSFATSAQHDVFKIIMEFRYPKLPLEALPRVVIGSDRPIPSASPGSTSSGIGFEVSLAMDRAGEVLLPNEVYPVELPFGQIRDGRRVSTLRQVSLQQTAWNQLEIECDSQRNITVKINGAVVNVLSSVPSTRGHIILWPQNSDLQIRNPSLQSQDFSGPLGFVFYDSGNLRVDTKSARPGLIWSTPPGTTWWWSGRINPQGNQAAAFGQDRSRGIGECKLYIWPLYDGQQGKDSIVFDLKERLIDNPTSMVYSANGKQIAFGTSKGALYLLGLEEQRVESKLVRFKAPITGLALSSDGKLMAAVGREAGGPIVLWDITETSSPTVRATVTIPPEEEIASLAFSPDSGILYAGGKTKLYSSSAPSFAGLSERWNTPSKSSVPTTEKSLSWLRSIAVSPSGTEMVVAEGKNLYLVELGTFTTKYTLLDQEDGKPIIGVDYSKDGSRIVSSGYDQRIHVWSAADGRLIWESTLPTPSCEGVSISPDGSFVLTSGHDRPPSQALNVTQFWKLPAP